MTPKPKEEIKEMSRLLHTVGTKTFIKYFFHFKDEASFEEMNEVFKRNGESWKESSCRTKITNGKRIFRKEYEFDALYYIINIVNENKIGFDTKIRAEEIYDEYIKKGSQYINQY